MQKVTSSRNKFNSKNPYTASRDGFLKFNGIYIGKVISNKDVKRTGRLTVQISQLNANPEENRTYEAMYVSPFIGETRLIDVDPSDPTSYQGTTKTYGMWMQPPDVGSMVLVAFGDGNLKFPFVIGGTLLDSQFNYSLPGIGGGPSFQGGKFNTPVAEKNRYDENPKHNGIARPINHDFAEVLTLQGLINDPLRGAASSSARRESPSEVFGILTKGTRTSEGKSAGVGHQFIMDDNTNNKNIRLRTAGGNQILLDDTTGSIYVINKRGTAWFELDLQGNINFFGQGSMSLRAKGDFNLRADKNVNIEAGNDLNLKAAGDNDADGYKGLPGALGAIGVPPLGVGGSVRIHATRDASIHANQSGTITANGGSLELNSANRLVCTSTVGVVAQSPGYVSLNAMGKMDLVAGGAIAMAGGGATNIYGATIGLNNPGVVPTPDLLPAVPAPQIGGNDKEDQSSKPPEYDRESDQPIQNGGERTDNETINTIVSNLVTAEPYIGHGQYDPSTDVPGAVEEDVSADNEKIDGQIDSSDDRPADVDTPEGTQIGKAFNATKDKIGEVKAGIDSAKEALAPVYENYNTALSAFNMLQNLNLNNLNGLLNMAESFGIAVPPFRIPTTTALKDKILGQMTFLKDINARLGMLSLDANGLGLNMDNPLVASVKDKIDGTIGDVLGDLPGGDKLTKGDFLKSAKEEATGKVDDATSEISQQIGGGSGG